MAQRVVIAVDVLGGDIGPSVVLPGIEKALKDSSLRDLRGLVLPLQLWWWAVLRAFPVLPCALLSHRLLSPW